MIVFAVASFALRFLSLVPLLTLASTLALRHQVRHFKHHRSIVRSCFVFPPTTLALARMMHVLRLRVLVMIQLRVVQRVVVVVVRIRLRYRLQL